MTEEQRGGTSRRTVLKVAGASGALAGIAGLSRAGPAQPAEIVLDGAVSGWVGRSPESVAGQANPALPLEPGRTYRVTWRNADGVPHSFVVEDAAGTRLVGTEIVSEEGATRTLEFEPTPEMVEYYCEVHPQTMRGQVAVAEAGTTDERTAGETTADGTTETPADGEPETTADGQVPVLDAETIVLGAQADYWLGLAPSGIRGRPNPSLRLRSGREYELVWVNLDGVEHDFHLADAGGEDIADTSSREEVGETHETDFEATDFEATDEMATYYCEFHPQSMRGGVEVV